MVNVFKEASYKKQRQNKYLTAINNLMLIKTAIDFLPSGWTKPYLATNENNQQFVIKSMVSPTMGKVLLNEYLTGNLAISIGLPWPKTYFATLSDEVVKFLEINSVTSYSPECVALEYIEDLTPINWPKPPLGYDNWNIQNRNRLPIVNRDHLAIYFDQPERQSPFYGRAIFETWIFMQDTKYDTLYMRRDRTPFFLDGSHAFSGDDWQYDQMKYPPWGILPKSPYLEGILTELSLYSEWLDRINSISDSYIHTLIESIPHSWNIDSQQCSFLMNLLIIEKKRFIEIWKKEIDNQSMLKQSLNNEDN